MNSTSLYNNVIISSLPGSGRSTLAKLLHEKFSDWEIFSGGEFMRAYAIEQGLFKDDSLLHHPASVYDEDFDRKVDFGMREWLETKNHMIIESWLCGFLSQGTKDTLKILLVCKSSLRIDRVANRDASTITAAKKNLKERVETNVSKWKKMYSKEWNEWVVAKGLMKKEEEVNYWDSRLYDLVIDTYQYSKEETFGIAYDALMHGVKEKFHVSEEWMKKYETGKYKLG